MGERKEYYIVHGKMSLSDVSPRLYAVERGGFLPFVCHPRKLHKHPDRPLLRFFHSESEARQFVDQYGSLPENQQDVGKETIVVEPAYPELQAYFAEIETDPRLRANPLLPLIERTMTDFNFARIKEALDKGAASSEPQRSIEELKAVARKLLTKVTTAEREQGVPDQRQNGFHAWYTGRELHLAFEIASGCAKAEDFGIPLDESLRKQGRNWVERY